MKELSLDECLAANLEFRCQVLSGIRRNLVAMLSFGNILFEFLVKLIEVSEKVTCACRSKNMLGMNSNVRMIALIGKEGHNSSGCTWHIVEGELS